MPANANTPKGFLSDGMRMWEAGSTDQLETSPLSPNPGEASDGPPGARIVGSTTGMN